MKRFKSTTVSALCMFYFSCFIAHLIIAAAAVNSSQILHRGNSTEPVTLDPHKSEDVSSGNILRDLYEGLVTEDAAGKLIPGAAEKWNISDDGLQLYISSSKLPGLVKW